MSLDSQAQERANIREYEKARKAYRSAAIGSDEEKAAYKKMTELVSKIPKDKLPKTGNRWT